MKNIYKFADIPVEIEYMGEYFEESCKEYLCMGESPKFSISVTEEDMKYEQEQNTEGVVFSRPYLEFIALYRQFSEKSVYHDVVLCHGSVVEVDGKAYMFSAPSGTGKSTHTRLWREYFGDRAKMINDDKPLLRFREDGVYAYGTPWDGKHHLSSNSNSKLAGICFLKQAKENSIRKIDANEALGLLVNQIYRPKNTEGYLKTLDFMDELMKKVPMYEMGCNISEEAVKVAYEEMRK